MPGRTKSHISYDSTIQTKQLQHGRGSTLCDETTPTGCAVEQEKFLRENEGRKGPVWWKQPTFSF